MKPPYSVSAAIAFSNSHLIILILYLFLLLNSSSVFECTLSDFTTMPVRGGTSQHLQACAACKYQRKKCTEDCTLAPHFPADKPEMFLNAHRLYGVRKIKMILEQIYDPQQKREAMQSLIYESDMRAKFPVMGCLGIINHLNFQLQEATKELYHVRTHITTVCKDQLLQDANGRFNGDLWIEDNHVHHQYSMVKSGLRVQVQQPYYYMSDNNVSSQAFHIPTPNPNISIQQETDAPYHDQDYGNIQFETVADDHDSHSHL